MAKQGHEEREEDHHALGLRMRCDISVCVAERHVVHSLALGPG